ncbi:hypothetical protein F2P81_008299 [Scophthalmus maximus]|uniref:Uncharacterized protein n=1 Tax=Scophthalmus maximus TaxID=52904 RepID=A0A6A4TA72_SCOMX|nr:hypothetical protein F2P81_008299 [Scophthalmus maximus]
MRCPRSDTNEFNIVASILTVDKTELLLWECRTFVMDGKDGTQLTLKALIKRSCLLREKTLLLDIQKPFKMVMASQEYC